MNIDMNLKTIKKLSKDNLREILHMVNVHKKVIFWVKTKGKEKFYKIEELEELK